MEKMLLHVLLFSPQENKTIAFGIGALIVLIALLRWMRRRGKR